MSKMPPAILAGLLLGVLFCVAPGCRTLKLFPSGQEKNDLPAAKEATPAAPVVTKPCKHSLRIAPYVFLADFELKRDLPLFTELAGLRDQVYKELELPTAETPVYVYLFDDRERYDAYMHANFPQLPNRRAFFIANPRVGGEDLLVFTSWGDRDRVRQDLRHELTHALLHSVLKDVPIWLDEGLAEYFELAPDREGVNETHLAYLRHSRTEPFKPDLARVEGLKKVEQMTPAEYREAWAWVHLMLRGRPEAKPVLLAYLQQLRSNPTPGVLRPRLAQVLAAPETDLGRHVVQLEVPAVIVPTAQRSQSAEPRP
jgi:hypothetical protein